MRTTNRLKLLQRAVTLSLAVAVGALALVACAAFRADPWSDFESDVERWGTVIDIRDTDLHLRPYERKDGALCVARRTLVGGGGTSSSYCLVAGWVVETTVQEAADGVWIVFGAVAPEAARIVLPDRGGTLVEVKPRASFAGKKIFVARLGQALSLPSRNEVVAFDANGDKLGNEHWNVGTSECPWEGPWDGKLDHEHARPKPDCLQELDRSPAA